MRIRSPFLTKLAARTVVGSLKLVFSTLRHDFVTAVPETNAYEYDGCERFLYCVWHDALLMPVMAGKSKHMSALVSRHQDGAYLAESMRLLNITPVRGSTSRGGAEAVRQLMDVACDKHITITPDGPRGPRRTMKPGIVFLASHTGRRIVPMTFVPQQEWRIKGSWTDMSIPKPFTRLVAVTGEPISVPADLSREEMKFWCGAVQSAMDDVQQLAEQRAWGRAVMDGSPPPGEDDTAPGQRTAA